MEEALASYRTGEGLLDAASALVRDGIVSYLLRLNREQESLECHDRYDDRRGKARTLVRIGRPAEALPMYQLLVAKTPADKALLLERADALTAAQRPFEASVAYDAAGR